MPTGNAELSIISCKSALEFSQKIVSHLKSKKRKVRLIDSSEIVFANTEIKMVINESIRGKDIYIIQDVENKTNGFSVDQNLRALYTAIDACRRCDAQRIGVVIPTFPYARQDKQEGREGITASRIAWELEGDFSVRHILTIDIHNNAIQGFFRNTQVDNLRGGYILIPYLKRIIKNNKKTVFMATDLGGAKRANFYAKSLNTGIAFSYKKRNYSRPNTVDKIMIMGDVKGKDVYIVDDMICTGGTLLKTMVLAKQKGAKSITAVCTLAFFNGNAKESFKKAYKEGLFSQIISTDATYHSKEFLKESPWFKEISVSEYFAEIIYRVHKGKSIGELLE